MSAAERELRGRVALVTGGSRGIGRGIALALAGAGADVAIAYRRDRDAAAETVGALEALGVRAKAYAAAMEVREQCQALVPAALADFGFVDILVNNAGIASRGRSVAETDPDELSRVLTVHALAPHWLCQAVLPAMRGRSRGDIVMISSVATLGYAANGAPYAMGKAAMEALAYTLAKEERGNGIHVNVVAPGLVDTDMGRRLAAATAGVKDIRELDARMPFGRVCQPEDIGNAVCFLVSPRAGYITGEKINVHGGGQNWR
ncbi:MAG TPA: SDR family oxidoreductase [Candidatus Sulfotelmatobacter sp.]|nr:SDR family oxidoreductase [Candidatus Sulfotelmatobacter sp.]